MENPQFFSDVRWPLILAQQCNQQLSSLASPNGPPTQHPTQEQDGVANKTESISNQGLSSKIPSKEVKVLPVFFVSKDEQRPTLEQSRILMRHLEWSQTRYRELLRNEDTFGLAERTPHIYLSQSPWAFYRSLPEGAAPQFVKELLEDLKCSRYTCPYVLLVIVINPHDGFPTGGGRPLNGGFNNGGGVVELSSFDLDRSPNFQSTLQHELGHGFGLVHVDAYHYDMTNSDSIMSYNPAHHTKGFTASHTPGKLNPEDLRVLALNKRVFAKFQFDPAKDVPKGYDMKESVQLGPMHIPGVAEYEISQQ